MWESASPRRSTGQTIHPSGVGLGCWSCGSKEGGGGGRTLSIYGSLLLKLWLNKTKRRGIV